MESGVNANTAIMPCGQVSGLIQESKRISDLLSGMMDDAGIFSQRLLKIFNKNS
jgi:hypothetical protein